MKKVLRVLGIIAILAMIGVIVYLVLTKTTLNATQDDWANKKVSQAITFVVPKDTNIRTYPATSSGEDECQLIISQNREYTWYCNVSEYYETTDYSNRMWYGVAASDVNLDDCPAALARWCEKNPDLIFWFTTAGGVNAQIDENETEVVD